jgi:hypothetical protein
MWFACGQEQMVDDSSLIARKAAEQGVRVQWTEYIDMPHLFAFKFPKFPQSMHVFKSWTDFMQACVSGKLVEVRALRVHSTDLEEEELQVDQLLDVPDVELQTLMKQKQSERKVYTGKRAPNSNL